MKFPEEQRLLTECNSKIQRTRVISRLVLAARDMTIEQSMRLTGSLREAELEYQKAEAALQAFRGGQQAQASATTQE